MKLSQQSQLFIESTIREAMDKYPSGNGQTVVTDIHLQPISGSGELIIFDDNDEELSHAIIEEWLAHDGINFYKDTERVLRSILNRMKEGGSFDNLPIIQPFSFVLVDEDRETITDLLLIDDDTFLVNEELLKGLDKELNSFLKKLLEY
ncbi:MAG: hypothetical protein LBU37_03685 [Tannerellaceae bacterium]|jgi:hypothetical protein|nr:hypothetical protein [Tannerellaceae bacterium]